MFMVNHVTLNNKRIFRAMIEPGVRYLPHVPLQPQPQMTLEAAVDLTKKSDHWRPNIDPPDPNDGEDHDDGSDSDTPLDMSVTATRLTPVFPGFHRVDREVSPARSDRSDMLVRLPGLYSPGSLPRDWSAERSDVDKGIIALHFCRSLGHCYFSSPFC